MCGPTAFMDDISAGLAALGFDASRVHTEVFGPEASETPGIAATPLNNVAARLGTFWLLATFHAVPSQRSA